MIHVFAPDHFQRTLHLCIRGFFIASIRGPGCLRILLQVRQDLGGIDDRVVLGEKCNTSVVKKIFLPQDIFGPEEGT